MTHTKIWIHAVWGTRGRQPVLENGMRQVILDQIIRMAAGDDIEIHLVNCWIDHVHCLIRLKDGQSIEEVVRGIREKTSRWINSEGISGKRFSWSKEYYAASVSAGNLSPVKNYILGQERQHAHRTYIQEMEAYFMKTES